MNSIITPFCETNGLYFNEHNEPEKFKDVFENDIFNYRKTNEQGIFIDYDSEEASIETKEYADALLGSCSMVKTENIHKGGMTYVKYTMPDDDV